MPATFIPVAIITSKLQLKTL